MPADDQPYRRALADRETMSELKAAVGARRELGPELEDEVLAAFLARVEQRVGERTAAPAGSHEVTRSKPAEIETPLHVVGGSLILSIPALAIAGDVAGALGLVLVVVALIAINTLYFVDRWVRIN